jgi:hypothetical protein
MFEVCAAHFYAIYGRFCKNKKMNNKKKSQNFKVVFLDFFGLPWLPGFQALIDTFFL